MNAELIQNTARHARTLRAMIGPIDRAEIPPNAAKWVMLAALEAAEIELLMTLNAIPAKMRASKPVCGGWTALQLVGHLADWDVYFLNWLADLRSEPTQELHYDDDGDRFNAWLQAQRKNDDWATVWRDFRGNRMRFVERLRQVPEDQFLEVKPVPFKTVYHCAWSALEHYLDHAAGVRRESKMNVPAELLHFHGPYSD